MTTTFESPSGGLRLMIRGLTVREADLLANTSPQAVKRVDAMDMLFGKCFEELLDSGIYDLKDRPVWQKLLTGDREALLIAIRVATYGPKYRVHLRCPNPMCQFKFPFEVDLEKLPVQALSDEDRDAVANGNRFETTIDNMRFVYQLGTGKLQRRHAKQAASKPDQVRALALNLRILEIHSEGQDVHVNDRLTFISKLPLKVANDLQAEMDRHDCGIDATLADIECPSCHQDESYDLPFGEEFFRPRPERAAQTSRSI